MYDIDGDHNIGDSSTFCDCFLWCIDEGSHSGSKKFGRCDGRVGCVADGVRSGKCPYGKYTEASSYHADQPGW